MRTFANAVKTSQYVYRFPRFRQNIFYIYPVLNINWQPQIANTMTLLPNIYNITMHKAELNCTQAKEFRYENDKNTTTSHTQ